MFFRILLLLIFSISTKALTQEIVIGEKSSIRSETLSEEREIWISLPPSYFDSIYQPSHYPVMYVLDPNFYFQTMVAIRHALAQGYYNYMQEIIIVGVVNTDRSRDLPPTHSPISHSGREIYGSSGGAEKFLAFMLEELKPYIDANYRTNGYSILNGHSFGGLFSIYALLNKPQAFNAYIAHDPSLWWDERAVYQQALNNWEQLDLAGRVLYVSMANHEKKTKDRLEHSRTIQLFNSQVLQKNISNGLRYKFEFFDKENHGTVFMPASYNAMRYIYNGICLPVKEIPQNPDLISQHYKALSDSLSFSILPPENIVDNLGDYAVKLNQVKNAAKIFQLNADNYPESPHAHYQLGRALFLLNLKEQSDVEFKKAIKLNVKYKMEYEKLKSE